MTIAPPARRAPVEDVPVSELDEVDGQRPREGAEPFRIDVRGVIIGFLVCLLAVAAVGALFEFPVAGIWYDARQRALKSDFDAPHGPVKIGQAVAIMQIPAVGVNLYVIQGDSPNNLRSGPGHRPETPLPGKRGNSVIVGHNSAWGGPFADLDKLKKGRDSVVVKPRGSIKTYLYPITAVRRVHEGDERLLAPSNDFRITLVTATGGTLSSDHLVITAISGSKGKLGSAKGVRGDADRGSLFLNRQMLLGAVALALAVWAFAYMKRRYKLWAVAIVVVPLLIASMVGALLNLDLVLSPLR